jgi:hypothetical protein
VRGGFCMIGELTSASVVALVEGLATGMSVHTATDWPTAVGFFASNLQPAAEVIHTIVPNAQTVVAADRDPNGVGEMCGKAAVAAVGGILVVSPVLTDFNDLQAAEGVEAVAAVLHEAVESRPNADYQDARQTDRKSVAPKTMGSGEPYNGASTLTAEKAWPAPLAPVAFRGLFGDIVRGIEPSTGGDPVALLFHLLTMFGNVIGRSAHWWVEADRHFGNLFVLLAGETSKAQKGTSAGYPRALFGQVDPSWMDRELDGLSSGERRDLGDPRSHHETASD